MKGILCLTLAVVSVPSAAGPRGSCGQWANSCSLPKGASMRDRLTPQTATRTQDGLPMDHPDHAEGKNPE